MPFLDVYHVTQTLKRFLEKRFADSPAWPRESDGVTPIGINVSPLPPDKLTGDNTLGLYLYHVSEDAHYKNLPAPGADPPPIRYTPMGLNLYYQLTPRSELKDELAAEREQLMMTVAVKALRDYPAINKTTPVNGSNLLGADDRLRIVLQPIPHNEAISFWTAGSLPLRLAAYYQVSVVLLEPEESKTRTGRVLRYGAYSFPRGAPRLDGSRNTVFYRRPGDAMPSEVELQPAQVPYATDPLDSAEVFHGKRNGDVSFLGSGLSGERTSLLLRSARWTRPVELDSWVVSKSDQDIKATMQATIVAGSETFEVLPGVHSALVKVTTRRTLSDGTSRDFEHLSNETPFLITPRLDAIADPYPPDATGTVEVDGWIFDYMDPDDTEYRLDLRVYVGDVRLDRSDTAAPGPGEFAVADAQTLLFVRPATLRSTTPLPLRIFVNGAESIPQWIPMPAP